ncbi:MAG: hypothetical protein QOI28_4456 [Mycobacterium sp.]|nr:hypothetical protein [Mycobacterium sp.]
MDVIPSSTLGALQKASSLLATRPETSMKTRRPRCRWCRAAGGQHPQQSLGELRMIAHPVAHLGGLREHLVRRSRIVSFAKREPLINKRAALGYRTTIADRLRIHVSMRLGDQFGYPTRAETFRDARGVHRFRPSVGRCDSSAQDGSPMSRTRRLLRRTTTIGAGHADTGLLLGKPRRRSVKHRHWEDI